MLNSIERPPLNNLLFGFSSNNKKIQRNSYNQNGKKNIATRQWYKAKTRWRKHDQLILLSNGYQAQMLLYQILSYSTNYELEIKIQGSCLLASTRAFTQLLKIDVYTATMSYYIYLSFPWQINLDEVWIYRCWRWSETDPTIVWCRNTNYCMMQ